MMLGQLLGGVGQAASAVSLADPLAPKAPPMQAKAKRIIYLFMAGAPSQLELFDFKPELTKFEGQLPPGDLLKNYRAAFINPNSKLMGTKFKFSPKENREPNCPSYCPIWRKLSTTLLWSSR